MRRALNLMATLAVAGMVAACGGTAPSAGAPVNSSAPELTAPVWMTELDLPGCDRIAAGPLSRLAVQWELLTHPHDPALVIAVGGGVPGCIDTRLAALEAVDTGWAPPDLDDLVPTASPSDDPVPIKGNSEVHSESGSSGVAMLDLNKKPSALDDPVPIRGAQALKHAEQPQGN